MAPFDRSHTSSCSFFIVWPYCFRDKARYRSNIAIFKKHPLRNAALFHNRAKSLAYLQKVFCFSHLKQALQTDRQTDGRTTDGKAMSFFRCDYRPIFYRFQDITIYWSKLCLFSPLYPPQTRLKPSQGLVFPNCDIRLRCEIWFRLRKYPRLKGSRSIDASTRSSNLCDLDLWHPDPKSLSFHSLAPWTSCANLQPNRFIYFRSILFAILVTNEQAATLW